MEGPGSTIGPGSASVASFTYETFTPELVAPRYSSALMDMQVFDVVDRVETMNETFAKVIAFLQNSGDDLTALATYCKYINNFCLLLIYSFAYLIVHSLFTDNCYFIIY